MKCWKYCGIGEAPKLGKIMLKENTKHVLSITCFWGWPKAPPAILDTVESQ